MTKEDEIDSFDDLAGMTLDLSDKNIVPDDKGKVEIDVNDAVQQGSMARNMIPGSVKFKIENLTFSMTGVSELNRPIHLKSVTIISSDGTLADGLSTSLFIMGIDKAKEYWKANSDKFDAILLTNDNKQYVTEGIYSDYSTDYPVEKIKKENHNE